MNWIAQTIAVTGMTLRSIGQRLGSSTVAVGKASVTFRGVMNSACLHMWT